MQRGLIPLFALLVAVGEDVGRDILDHYRREFEKLSGREDQVRLALRLVTF